MKFRIINYINPLDMFYPLPQELWDIIFSYYRILRVSVAKNNLINSLIDPRPVGWKLGCTMEQQIHLCNKYRRRFTTQLNNLRVSNGLNKLRAGGGWGNATPHNSEIIRIKKTINEIGTIEIYEKLLKIYNDF